jgi:hypothetical protein
MATGDVFINTKQAITFKAEGKKLTVPAGYLGYVPEWVTKTSIYGWGISGNKPIILLPVGNTPPVAVSAADAQPAAVSAADTKPVNSKKGGKEA